MGRKKSKNKIPSKQEFLDELVEHKYLKYRTVNGLLELYMEEHDIDKYDRPTVKYVRYWYEDTNGNFGLYHNEKYIRGMFTFDAQQHYELTLIVLSS